MSSRTIDAEFEEITEGEEVTEKQKAQSQMGSHRSAGRCGEAHQSSG